LSVAAWQNQVVPYSVRKGGGSRPWKIVNKQTGRVVGSSKTKSAAQASVRIRMAAHKQK